MSEEPLTVADVVEALLLFDEPMLNSRYHGMLERYPEGRMREELLKVPGLILKAGRAGRAGSEKWMNTSTPIMSEQFLEWGERMLLDSFLGLVESQQRLISYMARAAPTRAVREDFDKMAGLHREIAHTLREALALRAQHAAPPEGPSRGTRSVQEEDASGDLRGQVEGAIRASTKAGHAVRVVMLSHTALRHLRDQGCFQDGETRLLGTPVVVDFSWDAPAFALLSFDAVPMEEITEESRDGRTDAAGGPG